MSKELLAEQATVGSVDRQVEEPLVSKTPVGAKGGRQARTPEQIRAWLDALAQFSDKIPPLPEIISREWIYQDHD